MSDVDEADEGRDDRLHPLILAEGCPAVRIEAHRPPKAAHPGPDGVVRRLAIAAQEWRAVVTDPVSFEAAQTVLDGLAAGVEHGADRAEHRLYLGRVVEDRFFFVPEASDPAARWDRTRRHDHAGQVAVELQERHRPWRRRRRDQEGQPGRGVIKAAAHAAARNLGAEAARAASHAHGRSVCSSCALVRPETTRSSTSVSHAIGSTPFNFAVWISVIASAHRSAPQSEPANNAFLRVRVWGRMARSTTLVSISTRPSSRKTTRPVQCRIA